MRSQRCKASVHIPTILRMDCTTFVGMRSRGHLRTESSSTSRVVVTWILTGGFGESWREPGKLGGSKRGDTDRSRCAHPKVSQVAPAYAAAPQRYSMLRRSRGAGIVYESSSCRPSMCRCAEVVVFTGTSPATFGNRSHSFPLPESHCCPLLSCLYYCC